MTFYLRKMMQMHLQKSNKQDPEPDPMVRGPDPDPYQNVTDPHSQHSHAQNCKGS
jgi:hypothetical protein